MSCTIAGAFYNGTLAMFFAGVSNFFVIKHCLSNHLTSNISRCNFWLLPVSTLAVPLHVPRSQISSGPMSSVRAVPM